MFKREELKLLWPFYLDALISPMLFFMPAFLIVYFRDLGFNIFQISILTTMMSLFMLLFEIPTGAIADIYGRKFSVLLGTLIQGIALLSIFFFNNYYFLMFAFAMVGLGSTFNSGAREAWVTDLIKENNRNLLHSYFSKSASIGGFALLISGIIGAVLVKKFGLSVIWIVAGISFLVTFLLLSLAKEKFVRRKVKIRNSFNKIKEQSFVSIKYAKDHTVLFLFLITSSIIVFAEFFSGDFAWVTLLQELNFPEYALGYMWSAMGLFGIFASLLSLKFMKKNKERQFILVALILSVIFSVLIIFVSSFWFALFVLLSSLFFFQMRRPVERIYFHKFIPNKLRATVGSVESMALSLIGVIAMPLAGLSVDFIGAKYTIFASAFLMIPAVVIYFFINNKKL